MQALILNFFLFNSIVSIDNGILQQNSVITDYISCIGIRFVLLICQITYFLLNKLNNNLIKN